jgi:hypothetical protein
LSHALPATVLQEACFAEFLSKNPEKQDKIAELIWISLRTFALKSQVSCMCWGDLRVLVLELAMLKTNLSAVAISKGVLGVNLYPLL